MRSRSLAVLVALLASSVLVLPSVAHAEKVVTDDAVGDVQKANWEQRDVETDPLFLPAPEEGSTDVTRTVVAHGDKILRIAVHFRDLVRVNDHSTGVRIHTSKGDRFELGLDKELGSRASVSFGSLSGDIECRGLRGRLDREDNQVGFSVPTACIGNPRWVRLGVAAVGVTHPADEDSFDFDIFVDDANRATLDNQRLARGPKVHRG